jgi:hypothetical protein
MADRSYKLAKSMRVDRNVKRKGRNSKEKRRGEERNDTHQFGTCSNCVLPFRPLVVSRPSPPLLPHPPSINTETSTSPLPLNPQRCPSQP